LGSDFSTAYGWTLDKLAALWHHAANFVNHAHQR